jgi:predicted nucleotidyltransferase
MFTPSERADLRDALVAAAQADPRIAGAALAGSSARGFTDEWSDIDLALSVTAEHEAVVDDWTARIYRDHAAITHLDVVAGGTLFRVFLLPGTLQLDVAFWRSSEFGATGPNFRVLFGTAAEKEHLPPPSAASLIGMGWLYALHARSSIARGRGWQAEYMISGMRDQVLALACLRHDVPAVQGRGIHELPAEVTAPVTAALVRSLDAGELHRAFAAAGEVLVAEVARHDAELAARIAGPVRELIATARRPYGTD